MLSPMTGVSDVGPTVGITGVIGSKVTNTGADGSGSIMEDVGSIAAVGAISGNDAGVGGAEGVVASGVVVASATTTAGTGVPLSCRIEGTGVLAG